MRPKLVSVLLLAVASLPGASLPAEDIPLANWTVPPYRRASAGGGMTTMADVTPAIPFIGVQPCRLVDTRAGSGFPAGYGPPSLAAGVPRNFDLNSHPTCTDIPAGVEAYSLNVTVTNTAGPGHLVIFPQGGAQPTVSSLNYLAGQTIPNAVIVPAGTDGGITIVAGVSGTDVIIDINGYFSNLQNNGQFFSIVGSGFGPLISGANLADGGKGINGSGGILGVEGWALTTAQGATGVRGEAFAAEGRVYGVDGFSASNGNDSAGVRGVADLFPNTAATPFSKSGVRGESKDGSGTIGISEATAVGGFLMNPSNGTILAQGLLGTIVGSDPDGGGPPWAVHALGNIGASGTKAFLEPHPTDPTRVIQYIALEGPEAGTYFRGRARFQRGLARIPVPEDFRMVTDPDGLTVQITPIGEMASFAVVRMGLDQIVVKASRDVEFSYLVQGVRASFKDVQPVIRDGTFVPQSAEAKMPSALAERQKRLLIQNGAYNADGSVNMETARRVGWDRMWEKKASPPEADR